MAAPLKGRRWRTGKAGSAAPWIKASMRCSAPRQPR